MSAVKIIGGGLYGCLTAYYVAKKHPNIRIDLFEASNKLLPAFNPVILGGIKFNNGFHGIELSRAKHLFNFMNNELGLEMKIRPNQRGIAIKGRLIPYEAKLADWPMEFKSFFIKINGKLAHSTDIKSCISGEYHKFLEKIGSRYSKSTKDIIHLLFPWFFPSDYAAESNDEGNIFRNNVRNGFIKASYGYPVKDLFEVAQEAMELTLRSMNVNIHFLTKVNFNRNHLHYESTGSSLSISKSEKSIIFYCASSAIMLKQIAPKMINKLLENKKLYCNGIFKYKSSISNRLNKFSEILVADDLCIPLSRISFPSKAITIKGNRILQCEYIIEPNEEPGEINDSLSNSINRIFNLKGDEKVKLLDFKISRAVFFPKVEVRNEAIDILKSWVKSNHKNFYMRNYFSPINMAKTWIYAKENADMV